MKRKSSVKCIDRFERVGGRHLLGWRVLDEFDALFDIAFEAIRAGFNELLFLLSHAIKNVVGLLHAARLYLMSASLIMIKYGGIIPREFLLQEKWGQRRSPRRLPWQWRRLQGHRAGRRKKARQCRSRPSKP